MGVRKNYTPYLNKHLRHQKTQLHNLHRRAKHTDDINDWLAYKNAKATLSKEITKNKTQYINNKLNNSNDRLNTLQEINNTKGITAPRNIIHTKIIYNNPQKICNITNNYYIDIIREFCNKIPSVPVTPIEILKSIYPRAQTNFTIPIPTISDITQIIEKSKCKHSVGHDNILINMLKK